MCAAWMSTTTPPGRAWRGSNGRYIVTESPGFNPNLELDGSWTQLEPTP